MSVNGLNTLDRWKIEVYATYRRYLTNTMQKDYKQGGS